MQLRTEYDLNFYNIVFDILSKWNKESCHPSITLQKKCAHYGGGGEKYLREAILHRSWGGGFLGRMCLTGVKGTEW